MTLLLYLTDAFLTNLETTNNEKMKDNTWLKAYPIDMFEEKFKLIFAIKKNSNPKTKFKRI
ncbi:hypothetical protein GCM10009332_00570 [Shewanella gelidii]|uniref:Uncharacterized protein n=1 Tax=Shewanella gelidii TaxID=1642821 RepID=A0A917JJI8_9GAMM|nr:hypothetical protein GCM10009332_00570 [Shewanella gelidii]